MKNWQALLIGFLLSLLLASCTTSVNFRPFPGFSTRTRIDTKDVARAVGVYHVWVGTSLSDGGFRDMRLEYQLYGEDVQGKFEVGCIFDNYRGCGRYGSGLVEGTLVNGVLNADLKVSTRCVYTFTGLLAAILLKVELCRPIVLVAVRPNGT